MNPEQVKKLQALLKEQGLYKGKVDGIFGPKTTAAYEQYMKNTGQKERKDLGPSLMALPSAKLPESIQKVGDIEFDSGKARTGDFGELIVKDRKTGKDFAVKRNKDGSYRFYDEEKESIPLPTIEIKANYNIPDYVEKQKGIALSNGPKKNFAIVDKSTNHIYYFSPDGKTLGVETTITGKSKNDRDKGLSMKDYFEKTKPKDQDSWIENAIEYIDPTGISSWDDVARSYENTGLSGQTALEAFSAVPIFGKLGTLGKVVANKIQNKGKNDHDAYFKYLEENKYQTTPSGHFTISGLRENVSENPDKIGNAFNYLFRKDRYDKIRESRIRDYGPKGKLFTIVDDQGAPQSKAIHGTGNPVRMEALEDPTADRSLSNGCINVNGQTICFDTLEKGSDVYVMNQDQTPVQKEKKVAPKSFFKTKQKIAQELDAAKIPYDDKKLNWIAAVDQKESESGKGLKYAIEMAFPYPFKSRGEFQINPKSFAEYLPEGYDQSLNHQVQAASNFYDKHSNYTDTEKYSIYNSGKPNNARKAKLPWELKTFNKLQEQMKASMEKGGTISELGYKKNSPYKNRESLLINSNMITTEDMAFPIIAMGNGGESSMLYPNTGEYIFPNSTEVMEINPNFSNMKANKKYGGGGQVNEYEILSNYLPTLSPEEQDQFIDMYENSTPDNKMNILMKCGGMMKYQQGGLAKGQKVPEEYANAEVEGGETALTPDGMLMKFNGPSHAQGGINTNLEEGTKIFSEHLKVPEEVQRGLGLKKVNKKLSYAKLSEKLKTKPFIEMMNETDDPYKLNAAKVQLEKNMAMLESLFFAQEKEKEMKGMDKPEFTDGKKVYAQKGVQKGLDLSSISNRFVSDSRGILTDPVTNKSYYRNDDGSYTEFEKQSTFVQNPNAVPVGKTSRTFNVSDDVVMGAPDPFDPLGGAIMTALVAAGAAGSGMGGSTVLGPMISAGSAGSSAGAGVAGSTLPVVSNSLPIVGSSFVPATYALVPSGAAYVAPTAASALMAGMSTMGRTPDTFRDDYSENYMKALRAQLDPFSKDNIIEYRPKPKIQPKPQPAPTVTPVPTVTPKPTLKRPSQPKFDDGSPEDAITAGEAELGPVTPFVEKSYIPPAYRAEEDYGTARMDTYVPEPPKQKEPFGINPKLLGTLADIGLVMSDRLNIDNPTIYNRQKNPMFNRFYEFDNREAQRMADRQIQGIMNSNLPEQVKQAQIAAVTSQMQDQQGRVDFANAQRYEQKREMDLNKLQQYTDANLESRINEFDIYRQKMARVKDLQNQFKANRKQQIVNSAKDYWEYTNKLNTLNEVNPYFEISPITGRTRYKPQPKSELDSMQQKLNQYAKNPQGINVDGAKVTDMGDFVMIVTPAGEVKVIEKNKQTSQSTPTKEQMMQMYYK